MKMNDKIDLLAEIARLKLLIDLGGV